MELKLEKLNEFEGRKGPLLLVIMDGVAYGRMDESDASELCFATCYRNFKRLHKTCIVGWPGY